jgi:hypothetical protein
MRREHDDVETVPTRAEHGNLVREFVVQNGKGAHIINEEGEKADADAHSPSSIRRIAGCQFQRIGHTGTSSIYRRSVFGFPLEMTSA